MCARADAVLRSGASVGTVTGAQDGRAWTTAASAAGAARHSHRGQGGRHTAAGRTARAARGAGDDTHAL